MRNLLTAAFAPRPSEARAPARQREARRGRYWASLPWLVVALGVPASFVMFNVLSEQVEDIARLRFERQASDARRVIDVRIHSYAGALYGLKALFATHPEVSRLQFHRFVQALDIRNRYPSLESVNYMMHVPARDKERFEEWVRRDTSLDPDGYPGFSIKPPGERAEYFVLVYLEPMQGFEFALGRDLGANPAAIDPKGVAAAVRLTRDSGQLTASGLPLLMKGASGEYIGLAMRLAVYRPGMPLNTVEQRRRAFVGSVGAGFNVGHLMQGVLDEATDRYMQFHLYDVGPAGERTAEDASSGRLLYSSTGRLPRGGPPAVDPDRHFTRKLPLEVGGRVWEVHFSAPKKDVVGKLEFFSPWAALFGGLVSTVLLFGVLYTLASSHRRAVAIAGDMTKHLRESEASLAAAQRMAHLGNWSLDPASTGMTWSSETYRIFGMDEQARLPVQFADFVARTHIDDRAALEQAVMGAVRAREHREVEHRIALPDGSMRWVHTIVQGDAEAPVPGTIMDITERKLAEQELLESRALLNDAQKLAQVGCCQYSPIDGRLIWSDELYRIHGVDPAAFRLSYADAMKLVHPMDRARWNDAIVAALRSGQPFAAEFRIMRPDGAVRHVRSLGEVISDASRRPLRMLWSVIDITDQKLTEHALRASAEQLKALSRRLVEVQEAERRRLSRELHDRVGQNLTALSINLDMLRTSLPERDDHRARLEDSSALLEATVDSIENVMAELRPPMLDDYGLLPALHWYAKDFSKRTGIEVTVSGNDAAERLEPETEIALFRIAQEALTNVAKHAQAKHASIVLEHSPGHCLMRVTDDGVGIDPAPQRDPERRPRLGMVTMRERSQAIGGSFRVNATASGGTEVAISIP